MKKYDPRGHDEPNRPYFRRTFFLFIALVAVELLCMIPAYYLCGVLFSVFGTPSPLPAFLIIAAVGTAILFALYYVFAALMHRYGRRREDRIPKIRKDTFEALERIAAGDFDVLISGDEHWYDNELTSRINKMAQDLRSMEHLRQDFVSNVSHEIQSPLTSISGFAALLRDESLSPGQRRHYLDIIESESKRLSGLSDNLLKLSMLDAEKVPFHPEPYRLDEQLKEILLLLEPQWSAKEIEMDAGLEEIRVMGDRDLLSQVWINLLHNAIKFSHEGGKITVRLSAQEKNAVCVISDTGIGIPEEDLIHIFERFYKVDKARDRKAGGNGLGLSLVKVIAGIHSGTVSASSRLGEGSAFTVTIPLA